jgi:hypothetical protein
MDQTLEYDCVICEEPHVTGDRRWFRHEIYRKGTNRSHVHKFSNPTDGAEFNACICGLQNKI